MLDPIARPSAIFSQNMATTDPDKGRPVLTMVRQERMAGAIPMWTFEKTAENAPRFDEMLSTNPTTAGAQNTQALGYAGTASATNAAALGAKDEPTPFGFADLVDMVNPLQHIPLIGHVYRELSGDSIQSISQIMGGALFGGPLGAASGLINTVAVQETGKDVAGNAMALVMEGEMPDLKNQTLSPQDRLNAFASVAPRMTGPGGQGDITLAQAHLPGSLLSFTDLGGGPLSAATKKDKIQPLEVAYDLRANPSQIY